MDTVRRTWAGSLATAHASTLSRAGVGWSADGVGRKPARLTVPAWPYVAVLGNAQAKHLVEGAGRDEAARADQDVERQQGCYDL